MFPSTEVVLNALLETDCHGVENVWKMVYEDDSWDLAQKFTVWDKQGQIYTEEDAIVLISVGMV